MLLKNKYKYIYRTHKDSIDRDFYVPSFKESIRLDRAAGFFSLHSLTLSIDGIIRLVRNNGQINLICSPDLSQEDAELIDACVSLDKEHVTKSLIETIVGAKLSEEELYHLDIICNMLVEGRLTIKIAYQPLGIYHEKFGIFTDEKDNKVYFIGSLNETRSAFLKNQESIRVNWTWDDMSKEMIMSEQSYFNSLWNNQEDKVAVIDFPKAVEKELLNYYKRSQTLEAAINKYMTSHVVKGKKELYSYQEKAIQEFCNNGYRHFYEMATGTGKTFTSVKTIQRLEKEVKEKLFVVVCVPQIDLQTQWANSLQEEGYEKLYLFGGNGKSFDQTIAEAQIAFYTEKSPTICVAVYDTFFSKMISRLQNISPLFIIVDEAHNLTSGNLSALNRLNPMYRLGLSATIQRF